MARRRAGLGAIVGVLEGLLVWFVDGGESGDGKGLGLEG